jgi:hypothetical protein
VESEGGAYLVAGDNIDVLIRDMAGPEGEALSPPIERIVKELTDPAGFPGRLLELAGEWLRSFMRLAGLGPTLPPQPWPRGRGLAG